MASSEGSESFPAAEIDGELNREQNTEFEVDSTSADIAATSLQIKKKLEEADKKKKREAEKDGMQKLKIAIIVSAVVVAVAGAAFAITKKLREK